MSLGEVGGAGEGLSQQSDVLRAGPPALQLETKFHNHGVGACYDLFLVESAFTLKSLLRHYAKWALTLE